MQPPELSAAQRTILLALAERIPPERIDRLWIFPPHLQTNRENGLFVLSLWPDEGLGHEMRSLYTLRFQSEIVRGRGRRSETLLEEGSAPADRIERIISGVLARAGVEMGAPWSVAIERSPGRWQELLAAIAPPDLTGN